jgi:hypothetical protein
MKIKGYDQSKPIIAQIQDVFLGVDPIFYKIFIKNLNKNTDFTEKDYIESKNVVKNLTVRKCQFNFSL